MCRVFCFSLKMNCDGYTPCLLYASYCTRFFTWINHFNTYNSLTKVLSLDFHFTNGKVAMRDIK